jgi:hypothetical protein
VARISQRKTAENSGITDKTRNPSTADDLPFLSHFTKELQACNSFGNGKGEKFWEKNPAALGKWRFFLRGKHLRIMGEMHGK